MAAVIDAYVVDVFADGEYCSGYLIGPSMVLTARHGVVNSAGEVRGSISVRRLSDPVGFACTVAWDGGRDVDVVLLALTDLTWTAAADWAPVRFGRLPDMQPVAAEAPAVRCRARGFPLAQRSADGVRDVEEVEGRIRVGTGVLSGMPQVQVDSGQPSASSGRSGWQGMSGAAVFAAGQLIGVLVQDQARFGARLAMVPITKVLEDEAARSVLDTAGVSATMTVVDDTDRSPRAVKVGRLPGLAPHYQHRPEYAQLDRLGEVTVVTHSAERRSPGSDDGPVTVTGMGGIGKTQLVAEYADRRWRQSAVHVLVWVNAATRTSIISAYVQAAEAVGLPGGDDPEQTARKFLGWLDDCEQTWLVVLDDVTLPNHVDGLWPSMAGSRGQVIVTTRLRDAALTGHTRTVMVDVFTSGQAQAYLEAWPWQVPDVLDESAALAEDLGYLPLALTQAAAYIFNRRITCSQYRRLFADLTRTLPELVPIQGYLPIGHVNPLPVVLLLTLRAADDLPPAGVASRVLRMASVLDPAGVPRNFFTADAVRAQLTPPDADLSDDDIDAALANLHLLSIADVSGDRVRVHALTQRAMLDGLTHDQRADTIRSAADGLDQTWPERRDALVAQTLRANAHILLTPTNTSLWQPEPHTILFKIGDSHGDDGHIKEAVNYFDDLTTRLTDLLGPNALPVIDARNHLLTWIGKDGDPRTALSGFRVLLGDVLNIAEPGHPLAVDVRANCAYFMGQCGDYGDAIAEYTQILNILNGTAEPDEHRALAIETNIAFFLGHEGEFAKAAAAFRALLPAIVRRHGPDHLDTLKARANAAGWTGRAGDKTGALAEFRAMLPDFERALGAEHVQTLRIRQHIADFSRHADPGTAEQEYRQLIPKMSDLLGPRHHHTIQARLELAILLAETGRKDEAIAELRSALEDAEATLGPDNPIVKRIGAKLDELISG